MMKIFLVGFMGSGKTTIGKCLANELDYDFIDTDRFIEMKHGLTVAEIFARHGEEYFRCLEHQMLIDLQQCERAVIATGGGMPCYYDNMSSMLAAGKVVYLKTPPQILAQRLILSKNERPLIKGKTEKELIHYISEKLSERETDYNRANITVLTENLSINEILRAF